jgi:UDP-glucose 4-epimerase
LGYIGRAVTVRLAEAGHDVAILARSRPDPPADPSAHAELLYGDLRDRDRIFDLVADGDFHAVCHLAARTQGRESFGDPVGYYDTNLSGTVNLLRGLTEATRRSGESARLVFASTVMVYGPSNGQPIHEQHEAAPMSPYGASKLACEQLLSYQAATGELGAISLRVFAAAGAVGRHGDRDLGRLIPKALAVARGQVPYMDVNGDGSAVREFTHVADVAEAYLLALDAVKPAEHEVYNIGTGSGVTVREILATVEEVTGRPVPVRPRPAQPEPTALIADNHRARERLGWHPTRSTLRQIIVNAWQAEGK